MTPQRRTTRRAGGFTLMELVIAAALGAMVMVALQSAVLIAAKAVPATASPTGAAAQAAALDRLAHDVSYATAITSSSARAITFTVADRTGDALAETITYRWSGTPGDPLVRVINAAPEETVLAGVTSLSLAVRSATRTGAEVYEEGSETLLASYSSATGLGFSDVTTTGWVGQLVPVSVPGDVVDYRVTRARVRLTASGTVNGTGVVELRAVREGLPAARTIAQATFSEPSASTMVSCGMSGARYLDPGEKVALVVRFATNSPSCAAVYKTSGVAVAGAAMLSTVDGGATWTSSSSSSLVYELWGVYRYLDSVSSETRATAVEVTVETSGAGRGQLHIALAGRPGVSP